MDRRALFSDALSHLLSSRFLIAPFLLIVWFFSWMVDRLSGYGHYLTRLVSSYFAIVVTFAALYYRSIYGWHDLPGNWHNIVDVIIFSLTAFHGRGFLPSRVHVITDGMAALAGIEAVAGLLIEGLFIAAFARKITGS